MKKTILVAEDEKLNRILFRELLSRLDFNVVIVENGLEAVEYCKEHDDVVLVLMDVKMPYLDGYEATKKIKEMRPELPIIAQTAFALLEDKRVSLEKGCDDYITKPIRSEILFDLIRKYTSR